METYSMAELCKILDQPRQKIRRRIEKLDIKAINEDTRLHKNEPLEYDFSAYLQLAEEFNVQQAYNERTTERTADEQQTDNEDKDKIIEILERELQKTHESKTQLEALLVKTNSLLDQQQQLTLIANKEIEQLALEVKEKEEELESVQQSYNERTTERTADEQQTDNEDKRKWWHVFKKK